MNKVLLDIFSTKISDGRGSKNYKKIIFSLNDFLQKKYFSFSKLFFSGCTLLSKLTHMKSFSGEWVFLSFNFEFASPDLLKGSHNFHTLENPNQFSSFADNGGSGNKFRVLNFSSLNFQK